MEVDSVADLRLTVLNESDVEAGVVDARLAVRFAVGSVARLVPGFVTAN